MIETTEMIGITEIETLEEIETEGEMTEEKTGEGEKMTVQMKTSSKAAYQKVSSLRKNPSLTMSKYFFLCFCFIILQFCKMKLKKNTLIINANTRKG